jgi:hypothetical protein
MCKIIVWAGLLQWYDGFLVRSAEAYVMSLWYHLFTTTEIMYGLCSDL